MTRSRIDSTTSKPPLRLRVPASLAVALLGASASLTMTIGGCEEVSTNVPVDAGQLDKRPDAGIGGNDGGAGSDAQMVGSDAGMPDAYDPPPPPPPPPDASVPSPDAYVPPDAPPDAFEDPNH